MICYYYPPLLDVGCKRSVAFSKYFKKYGWNPVVLSVKNPDKTYCILGNDRPPEGVVTEYSYSIINLGTIFGKLNGLLTRVLKPFKIDLTRNHFYDVFCIPDFFSGWIPFTLIKSLRLIKKHHIHLIYVSCPPFSAAIIGILLKKLTRKTLILDLRDPFLNTGRRFYNSPGFRRVIDLKTQNCFLNNADLLIVTSNEMKTHLVAHYPTVRDRIFTVHNGIDLDVCSDNKNQLKYAKFTVIYAGNLYIDTIGSESFFAALAQLKEKKSISKSNFQFLYFGFMSTAVRQLSIIYNVEDLVSTSPYISYENILPIIKKAHLQLFRIMKPMIPTKLYEGIALNIPLLAIIPDGEVAQIVRTFSPSSYIIASTNPQEVADAIADAIEKYETGEIKGNQVVKFLNHFSRQNLTIKLMGIIKQNVHRERGIDCNRKRL